MIFRRKSKPPVPQTVPAGKRVYAIGDIHGRLDLLDALHARILADEAARGPAETMLVFLGDLVDRGPASAQVVERVMMLCAGGRGRLIKGNHEEVFIEAALGVADSARGLMDYGGLQTILSYGIGEAEAQSGTFADLADLMAARIPREHVRFLDDGEDQIVIGDYLFVHAGIRPGVALDQQTTRDLRWIRGDFLRSDRDHGVMVVHGHSISAQVDERANRIGIDTGAYRSGILTAIGLEGADRWYLATTPDAAAG